MLLFVTLLWLMYVITSSSNMLQRVFIEIFCSIAKDESSLCTTDSWIMGNLVSSKTLKVLLSHFCGCQSYELMSCEAVLVKLLLIIFEK